VIAHRPTPRPAGDGRAADGPGLLAGPILRRVDTSGICVWIATSEPVTASLSIYRAGHEADGTVGTGTTASVRLGQRLFVHLLTARSAGQRFPADELLTYDLELHSPASGWRGGLAALGLLEGDGAVVYPGLGLPSLFVRQGSGPLHLLHGSCRKLHGKGQDALLCADELLEQTSADVTRRPSALFLTGDQIYGDDVAPALCCYLHRLGSRLAGRAEQIPRIPPQALDGVGGRQRWVHQQARFTSPRAANHLLTFGEFAAAYLLAFSDTLWPADTAELAGLAERTSPRMSPPARRRLRARIQDLDTARRALPSVRRVLANVPTYMVFDDHDVTDDWNLTRRWRERAAASPAGRRIVANALAAFWAFQGWGNDPSLFGETFTGAITAHLGDPGSDAAAADRFEQTLWSFDRWSFRAPTRPAAICLDTRTQRAYDSDEGAARLIGPAGLARIGELISTSGHRPGEPLLLVSPTPVCGLELQERREKFLAKRLGPYRVDFEEWHSNLRGLVDLMQLLAGTPGCRTVVVLSGDVHYAMTVDVRFSIGDTTVHLAQLVSSGLKHSGTITKRLLSLLGELNRCDHQRVGWASAPEIRDIGTPTGTLKRRLLLRPVNTDAWADAGGAPVFLAPPVARKLGITQPPDYREVRTYLRPDGPSSSPVIGENNLGVVVVDGHTLTHRILSRGTCTTTHHARLDLGPRQPT
jgi:hypothetical protein